MLVLQKEAMKSLSQYMEKLFEGKMEFITLLLKSLGYKSPREEAFFLGAFLDGVSIGSLSIGGEYPIKKMQKKIYNHYNLI